MNARLLFLVLATGCGVAGIDPNDTTVGTECSVQGLFSVTSQKPISCRDLSVNVALVRDMMIDRKWVANESEFDALFSVIHVSIEDKRCLTGPSIGLIPLPGCLYGQYLPDDNYRNPHVQYAGPLATVYLNWDAGALAHELMHHYDTTHGRADVTSKHDHWTSLGYYQFAEEFAEARLPLN